MTGSPNFPISGLEFSPAYDTAMAIMTEYLQRTIRNRGHLSLVDVVALVVAVLSLLTFTVVVPAGIHIP